MTQALTDYNGDTFSTDTSAGLLGAVGIQIVELARASRSFRLWECLSLSYLNRDDTVTYQKAGSGMDLIYEYGGGGPDSRVPLQRSAADKNCFVPLINGLSDEGQGRVMQGRAPVIQNPNDRLLITVIGFTANLQLKVRGRYWEADTADEIYKFYIGLRP